MRNLILSLTILALTSCSGTRGLETPRLADMPGQFSADDIQTDSLSIADLDWWDFYTDPSLAKAMREALDNNRDLLIASSRVEQARLQYGVAKADLLPTVGVNIGYSHETNDYNGSGTTRDPEVDVKLPLTWEMNLAGSLQHARTAAGARYAATAEDYRAMRMTLIADVASAWFTLHSLSEELSIVRQTMRTRAESLEQARIRFEGGLTPETVYQQAKVEYSSAAALIPGLEQRVTASRNALALLTGSWPSDSIGADSLTARNTTPNAPSEAFPIGFPSSLLKRRPDLRASELRLRAAMADVGEKWADRFPSLRISLTPGLENDGLSRLLSSPFSYVAASVAGPVVDFGRRKKQWLIAREAYEQARLGYEKNVMAAFSEVSTAVNALAHSRETRSRQTDLRDAAAKYVQLARVQYRGGTLNYLDVLDAQRRYFDASIALNRAILSENLALVTLYKTLGGGWSVQP